MEKISVRIANLAQIWKRASDPPRFTNSFICAALRLFVLPHFDCSLLPPPEPAPKRRKENSAYFPAHDRPRGADAVCAVCVCLCVCCAR